MQHVELPGHPDVRLSRLGLGGHEYLADGRSRGFNEDRQRALTPGELLSGFGGQRRLAVLNAAYELGINFFDATLDAEKAALGRNLSELPPPYPVFVQTRPEGMCWGYDRNNRRMADRQMLETEVRRIIGLMGIERLDFLNLGFQAEALANDPSFLDTLGGNIAHLKRQGLIRFACGDSFSGEATYLAAIESGHFDAIFINLNFADDSPTRRVLPACAERGVGVFAREVFGKGALFAMGDQAGLTDRNALAAAALKWVLDQPAVTLAVVGVDQPEHLRAAAGAMEAGPSEPNDHHLLDRLRETDHHRQYAAAREAAFGQA